MTRNTPDVDVMAWAPGLGPGRPQFLRAKSAADIAP
jgi:hypothetical protein